ncbi:MAG: hypothetical protein WA461_00105 [Nitrososphaeraceae archaeon]
MFGYALGSFFLIEKLSDLRERLNLPNVDNLNSRSVTSMNFNYIAMVAVIAAK